MRLYLLGGLNDPDLSVVTCDEVLSYEHLDSLVASPTQWVSRKVYAGKGHLVDFPPNDLVGWGLLCSSRMMEILSPYADLFIWLDVVLCYKTRELPYFVLLPTGFPDVLDEDASTRSRADGSVIKPVFSREKTAAFDLFVYDQDSEGLVCSDRVKKELEENEVSGLEFLPLRVV